MDEAALRVQNGAYRTLNANLEQEIAAHRAKAREYDAAIKTLDSERDANAILTATIEAQARRIAELEEALKPFADAAENLDDDYRDNSPIWESGAAMSIDAAHLRDAARQLSPPLPDTGLQA